MAQRAQIRVADPVASGLHVGYYMPFTALPDLPVRSALARMYSVVTPALPTAVDGLRPRAPGAGEGDSSTGEVSTAVRRQLRVRRR